MFCKNIKEFIYSIWREHKYNTYIRKVKVNTCTIANNDIVTIHELFYLINTKFIYKVYNMYVECRYPYKLNSNIRITIHKFYELKIYYVRISTTIYKRWLKKSKNRLIWYEITHAYFFEHSDHNTPHSYITAKVNELNLNGYEHYDEWSWADDSPTPRKNCRVLKWREDQS